ncbi:hypothetical protein PTTG_27717 [Puccinia triticina 1-1 BBBD Race 1]|uniref:Uncharacterized protein n=1 Tax=Puccinia triticina (isolate 1-1 / race 1 (BBBD)) TaxID=630390 RepID=A0A180GIS6_PUCT1|nr:hypothetical protein PTTG_27717 [Puccinia triticina 1-1 BBBD Race 1]
MVSRRGTGSTRKQHKTTLPRGHRQEYKHPISATPPDLSNSATRNNMIDLQEAAATPLDTSNVEKSVSDEVEVTPNNPQEFPPIPPPPEATYRSKEECFQSIQKWALEHRFAITTASSYKVKNGICVKYQCDKSGAYRPHWKPVEPPDKSGNLLSRLLKIPKSPTFSTSPKSLRIYPIQLKIPQRNSK